MKLAAVALLLVATGQPAAARDRYTPTDVWRDAQDAAFKERWFGGHLHSMREPSLSAAGAGRNFGARYRVLVLPTFAAPYAVRLDVDRAGRASAFYITTSGHGGYEPGPLEDRHTLPVAPAALADFKALLNRTRFYDRVVDAATSDEFGAKLGLSKMKICADGTQFVFETRVGTRYTILSRHQCTLTDETRAVATALLAAGGISPNPRDFGR